MEREAEQQRETEVGAFLRTHRLRTGLTTSEASNALCIREAYLKAIEEGRFGDLPGPTYVAGFIRTYAEHLGLDGNEVVRQFKAEPLRMEGSSELRFPSPMSEGGMPSGAILLLAVIVALVAYGAWYVSSTRDESIAELISPLPERLVAFLRDGSGGADGENPVQPKTAPERSQRQGTAPAAPPAPAEPTSRVVSQGKTQISEGAGNPQTGTTPLVTPEARGPSPAVSASEAGSDPISARSSDETQDAGDATDGAGSQTETAGSLEVDRDAGDTEPRASAATPVSSRDPGEHATSEAMADTEQQSPTNTASASEARIVFKAKGETWVEIREEGTDRLVVARLFKPGDTFNVPNTPGLKLLTGNAGGLDIFVDGEPVPPLGVEGMVRRNIPLDAEQLRSGALARN